MSNQDVLPLFVLLILTGVVLVYVLRVRNPKLTTVTIGPLFLFLVAGVIGAGQLYTMGTMVLSAWVVAWLFSRLSLRGVQVTRTATTPVTRGETVEIRIEVVNRDRLPKVFLRVRCSLPDGLQAEQDTFVIAGLWPGQRAVSRLRARAARRGCYALAPVQLLGADPLDIFQRVADVDAPLEIVVYPTADEAPGLDLWGDDFFGELPARRVLRPAAGLDFHSLRDYQPGDDVRTIDWKATARLSRLVVVAYEPTQVGDLVVLLDNRASAQVGRGEDSTLERAASLAAGAVSAVLEAGGGVSLHYLGAGGPAEVSGRGTDDNVRFLDALARVEPRVGRLEEAVPVDLRARAVLLISPADDPGVPAAAARVAAAGGRPMVLLIDAQSFASSRVRPGSAGLPEEQRRSADELLEELGLGVAAEDAARAPVAGEVAAARVRQTGARVLLLGRADPMYDRVRSSWLQPAKASDYEPAPYTGGGAKR